MIFGRNSLILASLLLCSTNGFAPSCRTTNSHKNGLYMANLIVISPPGGVGEVTSVEAAKNGNNVKWFVVSPTSASSVTLSANTLEEIQEAGGQVELAGASVSDLVSGDDTTSAVSAVSKWCGSADGIVCTYDTSSSEGDMDTWKNAIKIAAREASSNVNGIKLAVLPFNVETDDDDNASAEGEEQSGGLLSSLFSSSVDIPSSLSSAMGTKVTKLRYGTLFGTPPSPDVAPFVGGPRLEPVLRDEYTMRSVRMDLFASVKMMEETKSNRLSVGEVASLMALKSVDDMIDGMDVCLTSLKGMDAVSTDELNDDFVRIKEVLVSGKAYQLYQTSFGGVPDLDRLTSWMASKWAPAVLKTYDIAGIRKGARPVFVNVVDTGKVEIVWQQLIDFNTQTVGKMIIDITDTGMTATRAAATVNGKIPTQSLPGEDVLVRRLSDAASQAIDKGLANKPLVTKKKPKKEVVATATPASTVASSGEVQPTTTSSESGPRGAGTRRSSQRTRGKRRRTDTTSDDTNIDDSPSDSFQ